MHFPLAGKGQRGARCVLIISIMMFLRKKTKLRIAYSLLPITSLSVVVYDAEVRSDLGVRVNQAQHVQFHRPPEPLPITPLAQSPFPEARPESTSVREPAIARAEQPATTARATTIGPSSVCFLTVAVNVNSGERLVALHRGTRVRLVREQDGKFLVRSKGTDFLIEKSQITDDLSQVAKLARNSS